MVHPHICLPGFRHLLGVREFYAAAEMLATSTTAAVALIRSHIAYHSGEDAAQRAIITPSRGHSYRVRLLSRNQIVQISDYYDHRAGVVGWVEA